MKRLAVTSTIVLLVAVIGAAISGHKMRQQLSLVEQQREEEAANEPKSSPGKLQRLPSDHRKMDCASHIGKLKVPNTTPHVAVPSLLDDNYTMTEGFEDCEEF